MQSTETPMISETLWKQLDLPTTELHKVLSSVSTEVLEKIASYPEHRQKVIDYLKTWKFPVYKTSSYDFTYEEAFGNIPRVLLYTQRRDGMAGPEKIDIYEKLGIPYIILLGYNNPNNDIVIHDKEIIIQKAKSFVGLFSYQSDISYIYGEHVHTLYMNCDIVAPFYKHQFPNLQYLHIITMGDVDFLSQFQVKSIQLVISKDIDLSCTNAEEVIVYSSTCRYYNITLPSTVKYLNVRFSNVKNLKYCNSLTRVDMCCNNEDDFAWLLGNPNIEELDVSTFFDTRYFRTRMFANFKNHHIKCKDILSCNCPLLISSAKLKNLTIRYVRYPVDVYGDFHKITIESRTVVNFNGTSDIIECRDVRNCYINAPYLKELFIQNSEVKLNVQYVDNLTILYAHGRKVQPITLLSTPQINAKTFTTNSTHQLHIVHAPTIILTRTCDIHDLTHVKYLENLVLMSNMFIVIVYDNVNVTISDDFHGRLFRIPK